MKAHLLISTTPSPYQTTNMQVLSITPTMTSESFRSLNPTELETAENLFERKYSASVIATLLGVTESNLLSQVKK